MYCPAWVCSTSFFGSAGNPAAAVTIFIAALCGPADTEILPNWLRMLAVACSNGGVLLLLNVESSCNSSALGNCPICTSVGGEVASKIEL